MESANASEILFWPAMALYASKLDRSRGLQLQGGHNVGAVAKELILSSWRQNLAHEYKFSTRLLK